MLNWKRDEAGLYRATHGEDAFSIKRGKGARGWEVAWRGAVFTYYVKTLRDAKNCAEARLSELQAGREAKAAEAARLQRIADAPAWSPGLGCDWFEWAAWSLGVELPPISRGMTPDNELLEAWLNEGNDPDGLARYARDHGAELLDWVDESKLIDYAKEYHDMATAEEINSFKWNAENLDNLPIDTQKDLLRVLAEGFEREEVIELLDEIAERDSVKTA